MRHQMLTSYRLERKCFNMGLYNQHWVHEHFYKNLLNLWTYDKCIGVKITRERSPLGMAFLMNIMGFRGR